MQTNTGPAYTCSTNADIRSEGDGLDDSDAIADTDDDAGCRSGPLIHAPLHA